MSVIRYLYKKLVLNSRTLHLKDLFSVCWFSAWLMQIKGPGVIAGI